MNSMSVIFLATQMIALNTETSLCVALCWWLYKHRGNFSWQPLLVDLIISHW